MALAFALVLIMGAIAASFTFTQSEYEHSDQVTDAFDLRELRRAIETQLAVILMTGTGSVCPDIDQNGKNTDIGEDSCSANELGTVPWLTFGVPRKAVIDQFGSMVTYVVAPALSTEGSTNMLEVTSTATDGTIASCSFVLIAHGPNGLGAITAAGHENDPPSADTDEYENVDNNGEFIARSSENGFDDRVECGSKELAQLGTSPNDQPPDEPLPLPGTVSLPDYLDLNDQYGTYTGQDSITFEGGSLSGSDQITARRDPLFGILDIGGVGVASEGEGCDGLGILNPQCYQINDDEDLTVMVTEGVGTSFDIRFNLLNNGETARVEGFLDGDSVGTVDIDGTGGFIGVLRPGDWVRDLAFEDDAPFDSLTIRPVGNASFRLAALEIHP